MPARHPEGLERVEAEKYEEQRELLPDWEEPPLPPPAESPPPEGRVQASRLSLSDLEAVTKELLVGDWDLEDALWEHRCVRQSLLSTTRLGSTVTETQ